VSDYLVSHSHATSDGRRAELEKSEVGQQIQRILADFDGIRDAFDLRHTGRKHSKAEMYTKMVRTTHQRYTPCTPSPARCYDVLTTSSNVLCGVRC
jgi:hypothetical protein